MNNAAFDKRLGYLEAARGIASVIVVFHHFLHGFFPILKEPVANGGLKFTPLYPFVNGTGAVAFFFVLSGFVLTRKYYQQFSMPDLIVSVLKRLPRLWLPAGLSMLIGAAILIYIPEYHATAARITHSGWLAHFAAAEFPKGFIASFFDAFRHSPLVFFELGHSHYNSNLWTMYYEFYGSMLVFTLVAVCSLWLHRKQYSIIAIHVILILLLIVLPDFRWYLLFVIGSLLSFIHNWRPELFRLPFWLVVGLILIMMVGFSDDNWKMITTASTAAMILLLGVPSWKRRLSNPIGIFLGRLSFPLYLVHVLVMLSVTSAAYVVLAEHGLPNWIVLTLCLVLTWVVSLLASLPFMALETRWVPALNRWSRAAVRQVKPSNSEARGPDAS